MPCERSPKAYGHLVFGHKLMLSIRTQLTLWNVAVMTLILLGGGLSLHYRLRSVLLGSVDAALEQRALPFRVKHSVPLGPWPLSGQRVPGKTAFPTAPFGHSADLRILTRLGQEPFGTRRAFDPRTFPLSLRGEALLTTVRQGDEDLRVFSMPSYNQKRQIIGVVQTEQPLAPVADQVASLDWVLLSLLPIGLLAAGAGGALLTARSQRPIQQIAASVARIQAENLSERLPVSGQDDYSVLAVTLNALLERLSLAFDQQRRFTADASHELKTPLAAIKAKTSVALMRPRSADSYRETLTVVDQTADQMVMLVQSLLQLAQADAGHIRRGFSRVAVQDILQMGLDQLPSSEGATVIIHVPEPALEICCEPFELSRVISNLTANARRHTPADGCVTLHASHSAEWIEITVSDTGEGIAPEHLPLLGERFYRIDAARSRASGGTGLGLAICNSIVEAHKGQLQIESRLGTGTTVRVLLPA